MKTVLVTGNTFPVKDQIKAMGGRWDAARKGWMVPEEKAAEALKLVASAPRASYTPRSSSPRWASRRPCGYPGCRGQGDPLCDDCG